MPTLPRIFNWGSNVENLNKDLYNQLSKAYTNTSGIINTKISKLILNGSNAPASNEINRNYDIGDICVRTDTNTAWIMTNRTSDIAVTWTQIS